MRSLHIYDVRSNRKPTERSIAFVFIIHAKHSKDKHQASASALYLYDVCGAAVKNQSSCALVHDTYPPTSTNGTAFGKFRKNAGQFRVASRLRSDPLQQKHTRSHLTLPLLPEHKNAKCDWFSEATFPGHSPDATFPRIVTFIFMKCEKEEETFSHCRGGVAVEKFLLVFRRKKTHTFRGTSGFGVQRKGG